MSRPKSITLSPTALDRNGIALTQTPAAGGVQSLTLVGSSTTFTQPQHVTVYSAGDDTGRTFTVTGTDRYGNAMTESITGVSAGTAAGTKNFATVTSVTTDGNTAGAVEVGWNGLCESQWYVLNYRGDNFNVGIGCTLTGTATYAVQHTFSNVFATGFVEDDATVYTHPTLTGETTKQDGNYTNPPTACRLAVTAHTSGTVTMIVVHGGKA